jgi:hypothetical protein
MYRLKVGTAIFLFVISLALILSNSADPSSELLFNLKRFQEKNFLSHKNNPEDKVNYYFVLLERRLKEIEDLRSSQNNIYMSPASLRYSTTAGELTDYLFQNGLAQYKDVTLEKFKKDQEKLTFLLDSFPREQGDEWKYIEDDINYLKIYSERLQKL